MGNWCFNKVKFNGGQTAVDAVTGLFKLLEARQKAQKQLNVPDFMPAENNFRDIEVGNEHVYFRSKHRPDVDTLKNIADHFQLGFTDRYEEPDTYMFGAILYQDGELQKIRLENEDFQKLQYDQELKGYVLDGKTFDDDLDAFDVLLDEKLAKIGARPTNYQR